MSDLDANFDNQLAAFMGGEKVEEVKEPEQVARVSEEETIQEPVKPAEPTTADKAKALGWNPDKDEFEAKTGKEWSTAGQYLRQREMADEIHKRGQELKQLRRDMERRLKNVEQPIANIAQNEHKQRLDYVAQSIKQAAIDQDFDAMDALLAERDNLLKAEPVAKQDEPLAIDDTNDEGETQEQLQAAAQKWIADNPWYNKLTQAGRDQAAKLEAEYRAKVDCTTEEALAYVAQEMGKDPIVAVLKGKLKSPDVTPRTAERPRVASASESNLDPASRNIYNKMISQGLLKTAAEKNAFIKDALGA